MSFVWIIVVATLLTACAEKFVLMGSPEVGGLLIVDPMIKSKSFLGQESRPAVVKVTIRKVVGDIMIEGEPLEEFFVFQGLKPGQYQLVSLSTKPGKKEVVLSVPTEDEKQFTFEVSAGQPLYLGQVLAKQDMRMRELGVHYDLTPAPQREKQAWKMLLEHSLRSQWKSVMEQRLNAL